MSILTLAPYMDPWNLVVSHSVNVIIVTNTGDFFNTAKYNCNHFHMAH